MKQTEFGFFGKIERAFGGSLLKGKRKTARPLSTKKPIHLVLKSTGSSYFHSGNAQVESIILAHAKKYGIRVYRITPNWSHIHLTILLPRIEAYFDFIRTVTAAVVRYFSAKYKRDLTGLFDLRPFTRILSWGREMRNI